MSGSAGEGAEEADDCGCDGDGEGDDDCDGDGEVLAPPWSLPPQAASRATVMTHASSNARILCFFMIFLHFLFMNRFT